MHQDDSRYAAYTAILREQLRPAMGCTEPIAIAYASAIARRALGCLPESVLVRVSSNIIKNAKSVTVPNTGGKKGIAAACAAGVVAGVPENKLEVIAAITPRQMQQVEQFLEQKRILVALKESGRLLDILVEMAGGGHTSSVRIADSHTQVVWVERDGEALVQKELSEETGDTNDKADLLTIAGIYDYASTCDLEDVRECLQRQIDDNFAIAKEGLGGAWGAGIGRTLLDTQDATDVGVQACAYAAAASDARMGGCELPVVINSGSGNQGITVSVPVICYAKALGSSQEQLYRALVLSNLTAIHQKTQIGCLSAYCGVVSAGCAAGAGIAYLQGGDLYVIEHTIVNSLAILSGTICDGAKASCAAKIASAVHAALLGYHMALNKRQFRGGDGIVKKGVENTIHSIGRLAKVGMSPTDQEILRIMTSE